MNEQINHMSRQEKAIMDFMQNRLGIQREEQTTYDILAELGKSKFYS